MGRWMASINDVERLVDRSMFGSLVTTAEDLAIFLQAFLNGGSYGRARVLSRVTVAEMTRNQIPGIGTNSRVGVMRRHGALAGRSSRTRNGPEAQAVSHLRTPSGIADSAVPWSG